MIYIIRHGKTELNKANVLQGQSDHPLNENGIEEAAKAAERLKNVHFSYVFSSTLVRAVKTAGIVVPYIEDPTINFFSDYKSTLQEYVQTEQKSIDYVLVKEEGPAHNKLFTVEVQIEGIVYGQGIGSSKKEAEQEAAKAAISKMAKNV